MYPSARSLACRFTAAAIGGSLAAAAFVAAPAAASPQPGFPLAPGTATLDYACKVAGLGVQPIKLEVDVAELLRSEGRGSPLQFGVNTRITFGGQLAEGLKVLGAAAVEGTGKVGLDVANRSIGDPSVPYFDTGVTLAPTTIGESLVVSAAGTSPTRSYYDGDSAMPTFEIDGFSLQLVARDASGEMLRYRPYDPSLPETGDVKPYTFRIACSLQPPTQAIALKYGSTLDKVAPSTPGKPVVKNLGSNSAELSWEPSTDPGGAIASYFLQGVPLQYGSIVQPRYQAFNLTPGTAYTVTVIAVDRAGNRSPASPPTTFTTVDPYPPLPSTFAVNGSAQLRTLTRGAVPLKGALVLRTSRSSDAITADLDLAPAQARLVALGFLPVTARIAFVPNGPTTGSLTGGLLSTSSLVRVKLPEVKLFGAIPLAGGNNCQTKSLSTIALVGPDPRTDLPIVPTLRGTFAISDLNGCGVLNGLVSPLTAGGGNAIELQLSSTSVPQEAR